jgi:CobQ-like glutamine amidotransferase family enzyme
MEPLRILHLYPRELGINGDVGNVTTLVARAAWRGIPAVVHEHQVGEAIPEHVDLVHIGSGPLSAQHAVHEDVARIASRLVSLAASGVPFLAIAGGWQLLGRELVTAQGEHLAGAGIFPSRAILGAARTVGEVVLKTSDGVVTGFENHSAATVLEDGALPFGVVVSGGGNTPDVAGERFEGIRIGESVGTQLHGSLLPMNPAVADRFLLAALRRRDSSAHLPDAPELARVDDYAARSREAIIARRGARV